MGVLLNMKTLNEIFAFVNDLTYVCGKHGLILSNTKNDFYEIEELSDSMIIFRLSPLGIKFISKTEFEVMRDSNNLSN